MFATTSVNLSPNTLLALLDYLRDTGATADPAEAVDTAVRYWLTAMKQGDGDGARTTPRGYQWKSLFLPDGSWLRMAYRGDHEYATVEGDQIMYRGRPTTPNQFASNHTNTVRNAWHDISIRMPGEKTWKMAYQRRKELELAARQAKNPPEAVEAVPASPPRAAGGSVIPKPPCMQREVDPGPGWTEPERRKYRYRLEDVAFD
jgi:hypothetical protein